MHRSLLVRQVGPAALLFVGLILAAIVLDAALHRAGLRWIGLYLGPVGVATLVLSFVYSLRKRKMITSGQPKQLLKFHQTLGWLGSLMLLLHGGSHFNSLLPWLALLAMLVVAASGITGGVLLRRALELMRASAKVEPDSAAEKAQLAEGDIVFRVGNREVNTPEEFYASAAESAKEGEVMLLIRDGRSGRAGYMVVPLE